MLWKKTSSYLASGLALALMISSAQTAFAFSVTKDANKSFSVSSSQSTANSTAASSSSSQPTTKNVGSGTLIEYSQIPARITANLDVKKSQNSLNSTIESSSDIDDNLREAIDSYYETDSKYQVAKNDLYAAYAAGLLSDEDYTAQLTNIQNQFETALDQIDAQIDSLKSSLDTSVYSQQTASLKIVMTEPAQLDAAQQAFLSYYSIKQKVKSAENKLEYLKWQESLAAVKLKNKIISQDVYNDTFDAIKPQKDLITSYETQLRKGELSLKTALGIPSSTQIQYGTLPTMAIDGITLRNRESDREQYIERSLEIRNAALTLQKAGFDYYNDDEYKGYYDFDSANLSYEQAIEKAKSDFEASYDALQDAYKSYNNAAKAHVDKEKALEKLEVKLSKGITSKNSVRVQEHSVYQSKCDLEAARIDLFAQFQMYLNSIA